MATTNTEKHPRRGNPNWGKPNVYEPPQPSAFEKLLTKLGLSLSAPCEELAAHEEVEKFAGKYALSRFVPEGLLKLLGVEDWASIGEN